MVPSDPSVCDWSILGRGHHRTADPSVPQLGGMLPLVSVLWAELLVEGLGRERIGVHLGLHRLR